MAEHLGGLTTDTVDAPKLATMVARRIEDEISAMGWPTGRVLGSESELVESFAVSRAVFREAVRILEHTGAATMRRGPGGGLVVGEPSADAVVMAAGIWISHAGVTLDQMFDVRRPLLMAAVRLAAERREPGEVEPLRAMLESFRGHDFRPSDLIEAEVAIARIAGNPAYSLFIRVMGDLGVHQMTSGHAVLAPDVTTVDRLRHLGGYVDLVDRIDEGDVTGAADQMGRLIAAARRSVQPASGRRRRRRSGPPASEGKLAERVAAAIRQDIEGSRWPVGEVLGSELELIERYDVSRAILREGVRILEHHGAVRTKRGPNGGVIVTEPDVRSIVRSARMVLQHRGVTLDDLYEARFTLEVAAARRAADRHDAAVLADLSAGLERELAGEGRFDYFDVHRRIAAATGNPAFTLFIDVMADLVPSYIPAEYRIPGGAARLAKVVNGAHSRIIDAIRDGDAESAARRMRRHLEAGTSVLVEDADRNR